MHVEKKTTTNVTTAIAGTITRNDIRTATANKNSVSIVNSAYTMKNENRSSQNFNSQMNKLLNINHQHKTTLIYKCRIIQIKTMKQQQMYKAHQLHRLTCHQRVNLHFDTTYIVMSILRGSVMVNWLFP